MQPSANSGEPSEAQRQAFAQVRSSLVCLLFGIIKKSTLMILSLPLYTSCVLVLLVCHLMLCLQGVDAARKQFEAIVEQERAKVEAVVERAVEDARNEDAATARDRLRTQLDKLEKTLYR